MKNLDPYVTRRFRRHSLEKTRLPHEPLWLYAVINVTLLSFYGSTDFLSRPLANFVHPASPLHTMIGGEPDQLNSCLVTGNWFYKYPRRMGWNRLMCSLHSNDNSHGSGNSNGNEGMKTLPLANMTYRYFWLCPSTASLKWSRTVRGAKCKALSLDTLTSVHLRPRIISDTGTTLSAIECVFEDEVNPSLILVPTSPELCTLWHSALSDIARNKIS